MRLSDSCWRGADNPVGRMRKGGEKREERGKQEGTNGKNFDKKFQILKQLECFSDQPKIHPNHETKGEGIKMNKK